MNGLAGTIALAPKPEMLVCTTFNVRCFASLRFALCTSREMHYSMHRSLHFSTLRMSMNSIFPAYNLDSIVLANPLALGATKPNQLAEHIVINISHLPIIKYHVTDDKVRTMEAASNVDRRRPNT